MARLDPEQLVRLGNAAYGAGLCAADARASARRPPSGSTAPRRAGARAGSTRPRRRGGGRSARSRPQLIAGRRRAAAGFAAWALELGCTEAESPIGATPRRSRSSRSSGWDTEAAGLAASLRGDASRPRSPPRSRRSRRATRSAVRRGRRAVLASFETRDDYLEDVPGCRHGDRAPGPGGACAALRRAGIRRFCPVRGRRPRRGRGTRDLAVSLAKQARRHLGVDRPAECARDDLGLRAARDEKPCSRRREQRRQRQRHAVDERLEPGRPARHEPRRAPRAAASPGRARRRDRRGRGRAVEGSISTPSSSRVVLRRRLGRVELAANPVDRRAARRAGRGACAWRGRSSSARRRAARSARRPTRRSRRSSRRSRPRARRRVRSSSRPSGRSSRRAGPSLPSVAPSSAVGSSETMELDVTHRRGRALCFAPSRR